MKKILTKINRRTKISIVLVVLAVIGVRCSTTKKSWRDARRDSAGIAPLPSETKEAVLHVYAADAWSWRGIFAVHTWIAAKKSGEDTYKVYDVVGWRARRGKPVMQVTEDIPDRYWFGAKPKLIKAHQGEGVDSLIDKVAAAAERYPWKDTYTVFPGPNSNTFIAWIAKEVPELELELPFSAIGSGYADNKPDENKTSDSKKPTTQPPVDRAGSLNSTSDKAQPKVGH